MSKGLFTKSLQTPKYEIFRVTENHFKAKGFLGSEEEFQSEFAFYNPDVKKSKKLIDHKFTNFVSNSVSQDIKTRIQELADSPHIIRERTDVLNRNNPKIDKCLELYIDLKKHDDPYFFKSTLLTAMGEKTQVRVFSIVDLIKMDNGNSKALFRIVLIDPFHLVVPSEHKGMTKQQAEEKVFNENRNNKICLSEWCKSMFE